MHLYSITQHFLLYLALACLAFSQTALLPQEKVIDKIWLSNLQDFEPDTYKESVRDLVVAYEQASGFRMQPGSKKRVGLKVYTNSGAGLRTPLGLVDAVVELLLERGYSRSDLFIIDMQMDSLWRSGFISSRADRVKAYQGIPVYALDEEVYYDPEWYYDSPLPSQYVPVSRVSADGASLLDQSFEDDRKSFLPVPLLLEVDFWINLPVVSDHPQLGINGVLANATLWNISNQYRFMRNSAGASAAIAEIAAIPELRSSLAFNLVSLEKLQFMGGPVFNSGYVRKIPELYLSSNGVALDRIFLEKVNRSRESMGFNPVSPIPPLFDYAASLALGPYNRGSYEILTIE
jgi:hypothetical protein